MASLFHRKNHKNLLTVITENANIFIVTNKCGCGGTGRRARLRI